MAASYVTVAEATTYFQTRLWTDPWQRASFDQQQASLYDATRIIDSLAYKGTKAVEDQVLRFPRNGQLALDTDPTSPTYNELIPTVPSDVKEACCDVALALLDGIIPEREYGLLTRTAHGFANTRQQKDTQLVPPHLVAGVPSLDAWKKLVKYLRTNNGIILGRDS